MGQGSGQHPPPSPPMPIPPPTLWGGVVGWEGAPPPVGGGGCWVGARGIHRRRSRKSMHPCMHARMRVCMHACMNAEANHKKQFVCVSGFSCGLIMFNTFCFWGTWQGKPRVHLGRGRQGVVGGGIPMGVGRGPQTLDPGPYIHVYIYIYIYIYIHIQS